MIQYSRTLFKLTPHFFALILCVFSTSANSFAKESQKPTSASSGILVSELGQPEQVKVLSEKYPGKETEVLSFIQSEAANIEASKKYEKVIKEEVFYLGMNERRWETQIPVDLAPEFRAAFIAKMKDAVDQDLAVQPNALDGSKVPMGHLCFQEVSSSSISVLCISPNFKLVQTKMVPQTKEIKVKSKMDVTVRKGPTQKYSCYDFKTKVIHKTIWKSKSVPNGEKPVTASVGINKGPYVFQNNENLNALSESTRAQLLEDQKKKDELEKQIQELKTKITDDQAMLTQAKLNQDEMDQKVATRSKSTLDKLDATKKPCNDLTYSSNPELDAANAEVTRIKNLIAREEAIKNLPVLKKTMKDNELTAFFPLPKPGVKEVVYFLDISGSVRATAPNGKSYIDNAIEALKLSFDQLDPDVKFNVIFFGGQPFMAFPGFITKSDPRAKTVSPETSSAISGSTHYTAENLADGFNAFIKMFGKNPNREYQISGDYVWTEQELAMDRDILTKYGRQCRLNAYGEINHENFNQLVALANQGSVYDPELSKEYYAAAGEISNLETKFPDLYETKEPVAPGALEAAQAKAAELEAKRLIELQKLKDKCLEEHKAEIKKLQDALDLELKDLAVQIKSTQETKQQLEKRILDTEQKLKQAQQELKDLLNNPLSNQHK